MDNSTPSQLRFPAIAGFSVRADFDGGALSSDFGALLLRGADQQIGLIARLAGAIDDKRHPSYIDHTISDLLRQRIFQTACGYVDGNDANSLRRDPMFKLAVGRAPQSEGGDLASGPTFSRLENSLSRKDIYRLARCLVEAFIASYATAPSLIVLDMDHSEDATHGQQELAFYNHHYGRYCYLPLFIFEGISGKLVTAVLRPGKRPTGRENAAIMKRVLRLLRHAWPETRIVLRGDGHFANPEPMALTETDANLDFLFGLAGNKVLSPKAKPLLDRARALHQTRAAAATRLYEDVEYQAGSWPKAYRVVLKAEVMALGDNPRFVVTSLTDPTPELLYKDLYCARGQDENFIKAVKNDLASDRTSDHAFLANHLRLFYSCAADVDHPETVQAGGAGDSVQGSYQAVLAQRLPGEGLAGPGERNPVSRAAPSRPRLSNRLVPSCPASPDPLERRERLARNTPPQSPCRHNTGATTQIRASASVITQKHLLASHVAEKIEFIQHRSAGL